METREFQRWTARRKVKLLLQLIRGERKLVVSFGSGRHTGSSRAYRYWISNHRAAADVSVAGMTIQDATNARPNQSSAISRCLLCVAPRREVVV